MSAGATRGGISGDKDKRRQRQRRREGKSPRKSKTQHHRGQGKGGGGGGGHASSSLRRPPPPRSSLEVFKKVYGERITGVYVAPLREGYGPRPSPPPPLHDHESVATGDREGEKLQASYGEAQLGWLKEPSRWHAVQLTRERARQQRKEEERRKGREEKKSPSTVTTLTFM